MKHLLNTLFVLTEDSYLTLDGENVVVVQEEKTLGRIPLHTLESILYFGYKGASPSFMGACVKRHIALCFFTPNGRFLARASGGFSGNVLLRKSQYKISDDETLSCRVAKHFMIGKLYNCKQVIERAVRDHPMRVDYNHLKKISDFHGKSLEGVMECEDLGSLRGIEGEAAKNYFSVFDELILQNKENFFFHERTRRPPMDNVNAMLSFTYTLLANDCTSALEGVGLDPYVGFLHRDRPGRASLALDLMEELRATVADRFVISLINNRMVHPKHFLQKENGSVIFTDEGRKIVLSSWQNRKKEILTHPFLKEKISWGLVPYIQALLLARYVRGDLEAYPPFMWK